MKKFIIAIIATLSLAACGTSPTDKKEELRKDGFIKVEKGFTVEETVTLDALRSFVSEHGTPQSVELFEESMKEDGGKYSKYFTSSEGYFIAAAFEAPAGTRLTLYYTMEDGPYMKAKDVVACTQDMKCYETSTIDQIQAYIN